MSDDLRRDFRLTYYDRQAARLVEALRALADRVERESRPLASPSITGTPRYASAAQSVNRAITWGIANAGAHLLMDAAYHADVAESESTSGIAQCPKEEL